jgi:hypothetical protein
VIDCVVTTVLQLYALPADAVKVTFPPEQKVVLPEEAIDTVGRAFTLTVVAAEVFVQPLAPVTVTE